MILYSHSWIYLKKTLIWKDVCTSVFIAVVFATVNTWKQMKCPSTDKWIKKLWCIYVQWIGVVVFQSLKHVWLFVTPWTVAQKAPLPFTISRSLLKFMSNESVMLSNHLFLCSTILLLPSIFPSIRVFSNELTLCIGWLKYWSFSFNNSPYNEYSGLLSFRID